MRRVSGFTLVELIVVIAILAILAATAIPRFVDLSTDARTAAASGIAGAIASGAAVNYAARIAGNAGAVRVDNCGTATLGAVVQGGLPTGTSIGGAAFAGTTGDAFTCSVEYITNGISASTSVSVIAVTTI